MKRRTGHCAQTGPAASTFYEIGQAHRLSPHRWRAFKLSRDRVFVWRLHDVVVLYVSALGHAVVLSVDEKNPIQALDRAQPGLPPPKKSRGLPRTHDHKRNGTTTRFAALNVLHVMLDNVSVHETPELLG